MFGLDGLEVTWNVFHAWKQFQQDGDREALQQRVAAIKKQMRPLLEWGSTGKRQRHVRALAKNLLKLWPALWTFADFDDVEPTNNAAERGLRAAVIYRKLSLGSRSQGGERTIERLLSVDQTCRLQRRSLYAYLADASPPKLAATPYPASANASTPSRFSHAQAWASGVVVFDHDVGEPIGTHRVKVVLLSGQVANAVAPLGLVG
jgi:transposase